jgi:signal transduction histidine kinase
MLRPIAIAYGRALRSQFSSRMLLLSIVPLLLSLALWGGLLYAGMQPLYDWLHAMFAEYGLFETSGSILATLGLGFLKTLVVPLAAMLALLPLMIITSLLFIGVGAGRSSPPSSARRAAASSAAWPSTCPASWCSCCCGS